MVGWPNWVELSDVAEEPEGPRWPYLVFILFMAACLVWGGYIILSMSRPPPPVYPDPSTVAVRVEGGIIGSGVILEGGYFLTAAHVIDTGRPITITDINGNSTKILEKLWISSNYDLALYMIHDLAFLDAVGQSPIRCDIPAIGTEITSEGDPLGFGLVTQWGKISSGPVKFEWWDSVMSITAPLTAGMSGGPVFDMERNVVGINVGNAPQYGGFYVAVPSKVACDLMGRQA